MRLGGWLGWTVAAVVLLCAGIPARARAAVKCGAETAGGYTCSVDPTLDATALCNDGTLPAFWWRPGFGPGATIWVIWLQGGQECIDQASCAARAVAPNTAPLITSNGFSATSFEEVGVLSPAQSENPVLYDANEVMLHYCSSDDWQGNQPAAGSFNPNLTATWNYKGRAIAQVSIRSIGEAAPAFKAASRVILGGSSAGGEGMTNLTNDLLPLLPAAAQVLLVNDAGFLLDYGQFDANVRAPYVYPGHPNSDENGASEGLALWHGRGDAKCDAAAQTQQQHVNCYFSSYVLENGYVRVPIFVAESQLDTAQLTSNLCPQLDGMCNLPHDPSSQQGVYATGFGVQMKANLVGAGTKAAYSAFSPDEYMHIMLQDDTQFVTAVPVGAAMITPQTALDSWLAAPTAPRVLTFGTGPGVD
jgi:hypothetical protein